MFRERRNEIQNLCERRLRHADMRALNGAIESAGTDESEKERELGAVTEVAASQDGLRRLQNRVRGSEPELHPSALGRFLLLRTVLSESGQLQGLPVTDSVKHCICDVFEWIARCTETDPRRLRIGHAHFAAMCKVVTFRRFPVHEFDWEPSGLPRSWLLRIPKRDLPSVLYHTAVRMGGRAPLCAPHVGLMRPPGVPFTPEEQIWSFHQMARCVELQPDLRGFLSASWLRAPQTHEASPRLAWLNEFFMANGALLTTMPADPDCGVLARSGTRQALYRAGKFKPTTGIILWPRKHALAWANRHPERDGVRRFELQL